MIFSFRRAFSTLSLRSEGARRAVSCVGITGAVEATTVSVLFILGTVSGL